MVIPLHLVEGGLNEIVHRALEMWTSLRPGPALLGAPHTGEGCTCYTNSSVGSVATAFWGAIGLDRGAGKVWALREGQVWMSLDPDHTAGVDSLWTGTRPGV